MTGVFTGILFDFLLEPKQLLLLAATRESKCTKYDRIEDLESKRIGLKSTIDGEDAYIDYDQEDEEREIEKSAGDTTFRRMNYAEDKSVQPAGRYIAPV